MQKYICAYSRPFSLHNWHLLFATSCTNPYRSELLLYLRFCKFTCTQFLHEWTVFHSTSGASLLVIITSQVILAEIHTSLNLTVGSCRVSISQSYYPINAVYSDSNKSLHFHLIDLEDFKFNLVRSLCFSLETSIIYHTHANSSNVNIEM